MWTLPSFGQTKVTPHKKINAERNSLHNRRSVGANILNMRFSNRQFQYETHFVPYASTFFDAFQKGQQLWGEQKPMPLYAGHTKTKKPPAQRRRFAKGFVSRLFDLGRDLVDEKGELDFQALMTMEAIGDNEMLPSFASMLLPFCVNANQWLAISIAGYLKAGHIWATGETATITAKKLLRFNASNALLQIENGDVKWREVMEADTNNKTNARASGAGISAWVAARSSGLYYLKWASRCLRNCK